MPRRPAWIVAGAVLALVAAGCSSGSDGSKASSTTSSRPKSTTTSIVPTTTVAPATGATWSTYYGDAARDGVATDGPPSAASVRRQWASPTLDGDLYAQPLVVGDRVIVATENDTVYSLNATDGSIAWRAHLGEPVAGSSLPCGNVDPVGITGTPVVDIAANRVYAAGIIQPGQHMLWALDLATGQLINTVRVDAPGADPAVQNQRGALTLSNATGSGSATVYVPYGGRYGDCGDYHGRVVAVAATSAGLGAVTSYTLPTHGQGGFWTPPGASVAADGSLYLTSGNSEDTTTFDYGDSVVRLTPALTLADYFAPSNWAALNRSDGDLGTTGPVLLPNSRVFQVGKAGIGYLLDANHLGGIGGQLHDAQVCSQSAFGAVPHDGATMFVPCLDGVVQVTVTMSGDSFTVGWKAPLSTPGPPIVTAGAVWTVATGRGTLVAVSPSSGETVFSQQIGTVPSRFTSPAAGGGRVVVGANRVVLAFGA